MVGARSLAMGAQPADRRGHRRAQPADGRPRAPGRLLRPPGRRSSALASLALFLIAVWQLDPIVRWLWPIPVAGVRRLPVPQALHVALPPLARRRRRARAGGRVGGDHRRAAVAGVGARRRGRAAGSPGSTSSTRSSTSRSTGARACTRVATRFGDAARSGARGCSTSLTVACSSRPGSASGRRRLLARRRGRRRRCSLYEHSLVRPGDLRRLDAAFFTMNGVISVVFFAFVLADCDVPRDPGARPLQAASATSASSRGSTSSCPEAASCSLPGRTAPARRRSSALRRPCGADRRRARASTPPRARSASSATSRSSTAS